MFHTTFEKGRKVKIVMKSGDVIIDKWEGKKSGVLFFRESGRIKTCDIKTIVRNWRGVSGDE